MRNELTELRQKIRTLDGDKSANAIFFNRWYDIIRTELPLLPVAPFDPDIYPPGTELYDGMPLFFDGFEANSLPKKSTIQTYKLIGNNYSYTLLLPNEELVSDNGITYIPENLFTTYNLFKNEKIDIVVIFQFITPIHCIYSFSIIAKPQYPIVLTAETVSDEVVEMLDENGNSYSLLPNTVYEVAIEMNAFGELGGNRGCKVYMPDGGTGFENIYQYDSGTVPDLNEYIEESSNTIGIRERPILFKGRENQACQVRLTLHKLTV